MDYRPVFVLMLGLVLATTSGCLQKNKKKAEAANQTGGEAAQANLTGGGAGPMACKCAELLAASNRPQFPKVLRGNADRGQFQNNCEYNARPTGANPNASLAVTITKVQGAPDFDGAVDDILDLFSRTVEKQEQKGTSSRQFIAIVDGALGKSVVGVTFNAPYLIETIEYLDAAAADLSEERNYLTALPGRVANACRLAGE